MLDLLAPAICILSLCTNLGERDECSMPLLPAVVIAVVCNQLRQQRACRCCYCVAAQRQCHTVQALLHSVGLILSVLPDFILPMFHKAHLKLLQHVAPSKR